MTAPQTCARCGQEVRYGVRAGIKGWLHREDVDHLPLFGQLWTAEDQARVEASLVEMAARGKADKAKAEAEAAEQERETWDEVPEPEIRCTDIDPDSFPARAGIRQICNLIKRTESWELKRVTYARGPYVGARGQVLSISDHHKISALGPIVPGDGLDAGQRFVVASWRDMKFDAGYTGLIRGQTVYPHPANSDAMKAWIKEPPP